jgi:hypothetical protein
LIWYGVLLDTLLGWNVFGHCVVANRISFPGGQR